jgi:hypothetical protein
VFHHGDVPKPSLTQPFPSHLALIQSTQQEWSPYQSGINVRTTSILHRASSDPNHVAALHTSAANIDDTAAMLNARSWIVHLVAVRLGGSRREPWTTFTPN